MTIRTDRSAPSYTDLLNRYELEQRLQITKRAAIALLVSSMVGFGGNLGYVFSRPHPTSLMPASAILSIFGAIVVYAGMLIVAYRAAQRRNIGLASYLTVLGCALLVVGIQIVWIGVARQSGSPVGLDDQSWQMFMAYFVPIVLCVVIGDTILLSLTVGALNGISVTILGLAFLSTGQDVSSRHQFIGLLIGVLMTEWSVAIIVLAMRSGFRRIIFDATHLQYAVERAKQLDELKDHFISSVNHELRNPVMALRGYLDALQILDPTLPSDQRCRFVNQAVRSCQHMQDLIESVLSVRQIEQSLVNVRCETVNVLEVTRAAASQLDPRETRTSEREVRLHISPDLVIWGDRVRVQQLLTNLLSNAMKYSAPGTAIQVSADRKGGQDGGGDRVEILVRDFGFGIPPEQVSLLFGRFVRLPRDLASNIVGNGLGLFLCRQLTEAMGGRIWAESTGVSGEGSTFHVILPATQTPLTAPSGRI